MKEQSHLNYISTINLGSYYTPDHLVNIVYKMLQQYVENIKNYIIMDTSCGYGNFLKFPNAIGADCDFKALNEAQKAIPTANFYCHNSLKNVNREAYKLSEKDKIIIVGNPPYNDTTSIIRNKIKSEVNEVDIDIKHRDLGISFLLSYNKLKADYICVLHPLSYLIKKANFESLKTFKENYILLNSIIVSSKEFYATSKTTQFPIIIALYKRDDKGMTYDYITKCKFKTINNKIFSLNQFDKLSNYITKYPNQKNVSLKDTVAFFWTMRDINALKRTKTFIKDEVYNSIRVTKDKLNLYCYADVFKEYIKHIPYYFGNSDIMIDYPSFQKVKSVFLYKSLSKYPFLKEILLNENDNEQKDIGLIDVYFENLLGEHYVD